MRHIKNEEARVIALEARTVAMNITMVMAMKKKT